MVEEHLAHSQLFEYLQVEYSMANMMRCQNKEKFRLDFLLGYMSFFGGVLSIVIHH